MKRIFAIILSMILLIGCTSNQNQSLEYVVKSIFSTTDVSYLQKLTPENAQDVQVSIQEFYDDYATEKMVNIITAQLLSYQWSAYENNKKLEVTSYKEKQEDQYIEVVCTLTYDDKNIDVVLHAQIENDKVSSLKIVDGDQLNEAFGIKNP